MIWFQRTLRWQAGICCCKRYVSVVKVREGKTRKNYCMKESGLEANQDLVIRALELNAVGLNAVGLNDPGL